MRVKRGTTKLKHRKYILARTKGMRGNIRKKERQANEVLAHAGNHAFNDRRKKKNDFRRLWTARINAGTRPLGISYSRFMNLLKEANSSLNRKVLSEMAKDEPESFKRLVESVQK